MTESDGCLVVLAVFKTAVALRERGELGSIPSLSDSGAPAIVGNFGAKGADVTTKEAFREW